PNQCASPQICGAVVEDFIAFSTSMGSMLSAFSAPHFHRSRFDAYSQDTAVQVPGWRLLYSVANSFGFLKLTKDSLSFGSSKSGNWKMSPSMNSLLVFSMILG